MLEQRTSFLDKRRVYAARTLMGIGILAVTYGCYTSAVTDSQSDDIVIAPVSQAGESRVHDFDQSTDETELSEPDPQEEPAIERNAFTGDIVSTNLFGKNKIRSMSVESKGKRLDLTPPVHDGIVNIVFSNPDDNPDGYEFNGSLRTDEKGKITGDMLLGGHSNSGDGWVMNAIDDLKKGDTFSVMYDDAEVTAKVTKITHIKKIGPNHTLPGFIEALGKDGAVFACKLTKVNGDMVQSGYVTVVGIKIIALEQK